MCAVSWCVFDYKSLDFSEVLITTKKSLPITSLAVTICIHTHTLVRARARACARAYTHKKYRVPHNCRIRKIFILAPFEYTAKIIA